MSLLTGLQWHWDLGSASATITDQQSGLVLTKGGTATTVTGGAPDGGDCVSVGSAAGWYFNSSVPRTIDTNSGFSVNIWAYSTGTSAVGNWAISHRAEPATANNWQIITRLVSTSTDTCTTHDGAGSVRRADYTQQAINGWHMFTLVDSGNVGSLKLYVDGVLRDTDATTLTTRQTAAQPFAIGTSSWDLGNAVTTHRGRLFAASVWGRVLTAGDITQLFNSGAGLRFSAFATIRRQRRSQQNII